MKGNMYKALVFRQTSNMYKNTGGVLTHAVLKHQTDQTKL